VSASENGLAAMTGAEIRSIIRNGGLRRSTAGLAAGHQQANLVILPAPAAADFRRFCERNPRPCPLLEVTEPGSPEPRQTAPGADLRTDIPGYRVYRKGVLEREVENLLDMWQDDFVGFLLGCSFTFEAALDRAGVPLRHVELGRTVPMYRTGLSTMPAGPFHGPVVVSMRPVPREMVKLATEVTGRYERSHGAPIHAGDPAEIGIADLSHPDYGDAVPIYEGEIPVFWACGVTPQAAAEVASIDLMITHAPGRMFVTDVRED
jgi:uncharacterized protein YcsI (UPF0317 family)